MESETDNKVTIKCALLNKCLNQRVFDQINADVLEISEWAVETSIYINYCLHEDWENGVFFEERLKLNHFLRYFKELQNNVRAVYNINPGYEQIRTETGIVKKYDGSYRSNLFIATAKKYRTIFINNIWMHAYPRLKRFLKHFSKDNKKIYQTLESIFREDSEHVGDEYLLGKLEVWLDYDPSKHQFSEIKYNYYKFVDIFYNLQKFNTHNGYKNFALVPLFKHGRMHVQYDNKALHELLRRLAFDIPGRFNLLDVRELWRDFFQYEQLETRNKKFRYSIQTDGISVSFSMQHTSPEEKKSKKTKKSRKRKKDNDDPTSDDPISDDSVVRYKQRLDNGEYTSFIGLDPGYRLMVGGVKDREDGTRAELIKIKSSDFRHCAEYGKRKQKLNRWTRQCEAEAASELSPNNYEEVEEYTRHRLEHFNIKQRTYEQAKIARLKLDKYIKTDQAINHIVDTLVAREERGTTLVVIGSTKTASNSPIKGYIRAPQPKLLRRLKTVADVMEIGEFRTTKLCSNCFEFTKVMRSPHRHSICPNSKCRTVWNRDVNAGKNILQLGRDYCLRQLPKPANFMRNSEASKLAC